MLRRFAPPPDRILTISHEGSDFQVLVRAKTAARRLTLRVESATRRVVLTMPARATIATAQDFALRHGGWIAARVARLPAPAPFEPDAIVPLRGVEHRIVPAPHLRGRVVTATCEDRGLVLRVGGESAHLARRVADFLKAEARRDLVAAVARHSGTVGCAPAQISIRDTRSRWGSCSASRRLSFSWRLILAPAPVLNYLAAHEVAHLVEMNHSARFWRVVRTLDPAMDEAEAWLKRHGGGLHRYG